MSSFTQEENRTGSLNDLSKGTAGAWQGSKEVMAKAALDITREGK